MQRVHAGSPFTREPPLLFFPPLATFDPPYPIAPDGLLPNSVLLSKMRKSDADRALALGWKPPSLSDRQRKLMEEMKEVKLRADPRELQLDWEGAITVFKSYS